MREVWNMSVLKKVFSKWNWQSLIVSFCILAVCVGTQQIQTVAWNTGIIEFSRDSLGVLMALILFTNYSRRDFIKYKHVYFTWGILGALLGVILVPFAIKERLDFLMADTIIIAAGIYLMGFCIIHTVISFFIEKNRPRFYRPLIIIWTLMMILMIFSRSKYLWPECYFVLFLCYYLTPQTSVQRKNVITGLINGMILGYIFIQAHSCLFRPYDRFRYQGNFCNPNHNCMFLCLCLVAILAKILILIKTDEKKIVKVFYFVLAGSCYSFICMTMCRSGYLSAFVATVFFLIAYCRLKGKVVFFRMGIVLVSLFVIMLPLTYLAVRYIPTIHPHVLFYYQEGYSENLVHSWDPRDSEKFVTFRQMLQGIFGRFEDIKNSVDNLQGKENDEKEIKKLRIVACTDYFPLAVLADNLAVSADIETDPDKIPALTEDERGNSIIVRKTIYKWYFTHLSLRGMPYDEQGFQLTSGHWIQDTHNIYLDYGINFGYPVMILFTVFIWWGIGRLFRQGFKKRDTEKLICLLIAVIPPVFGLFEFSWGAGMISTVAFYMAFKEMFCENHLSPV